MSIKKLFKIKDGYINVIKNNLNVNVNYSYIVWVLNNLIKNEKTLFVW